MNERSALFLYFQVQITDETRDRIIHAEKIHAFQTETRDLYHKAQFSYLALTDLRYPGLNLCSFTLIPDYLKSYKLSG